MVITEKQKKYLRKYTQMKLKEIKALSKRDAWLLIKQLEEKRQKIHDYYSKDEYYWEEYGHICGGDHFNPE